jgi:putative chitinase
MPNENELSLLRAARGAGIASREEMANFMAQMGHESAGFTRMEEGFRYTRGIHQIPVRSAWREGAEALESARREALQGRPQELGRLMYGDRMGNDDAGDGYLYRGRGYTQLTGESNYATAGAALELDLTTHPEFAADRGNAERIAIWFWQHEVPAHDRDDVSRATRAINNGENGLEDRLNRYDAWHAVLTPAFVADVDADRVRAGTPVMPATGRPAMEDGALRRLETGEDVRQLNERLGALDVRADHNRRVPAGDVFTRETEQAVRSFQEQHALSVTGRADPSTLREIDRAAERRDPQADDTQALPNIGQPVPHQSSIEHPVASTGDPDLDRLAAALFAGDDRAADREIARIAESGQIRQFEQSGRDLLTERSQDSHQQDARREPQGRELSI